MTDKINSSEHDVLSRAEIICSSDQVRDALDKIAAMLNDRLKDANPIVLCVMKGGIVFAGQLLTRLTCELDLDYIHVTRYHNQTSGDKLEWLVYPDSDLDGRTVIIMDDILDEGITLKAIIEYCQSKGAKEVISAVLVQKKHDRLVDGIQCDYIGLEVSDKYVFGFGMDYKGRYRYLNAIYAVND